MTPTSAQDDLAFLRALTDGDVARRHQAIFGRVYFGSGLIYGAWYVAGAYFDIGFNDLPVIMPGLEPKA